MALYFSNDSIISIVIMFFVILIFAVMFVAPFFAIWYWISNRRIKNSAKQYMESPNYIKDLEELKAGVNYISKGGVLENAIQKERNNQGSAGSSTGTTSSTGNSIGINKITRGEYSTKAESTINQSRFIDTNRNKRRITLH
jgi:hypothetical protein